MKRIFLGFLIIITLFVVGCSESKAETKTNKNKEGMIRITKQEPCSIYVDKETRVMYLFCHTMSGFSVTVMYDAWGNPRIYNESVD